MGFYCTRHKTHRDKLPISHLLLMARQVFTITHIRMQVVWARRDHWTSDHRDDLCPYGRVRVVVRRGPGLAFHIGRQVRGGHLGSSSIPLPQTPTLSLSHLLISIPLPQTPTLSLSRARTIPPLLSCQPPPEDTQCQVCQSPFDERKMLLCDTCNAGWHMNCLLPPSTIPAGMWKLPFSVHPPLPHPRVHYDTSGSPPPSLTLTLIKHCLGKKRKKREKKTSTITFQQ